MVAKFQIMISLRTQKVLADMEASNLADYAVKSLKSKGRTFKERLDDNRLCFQKDKERIIHCKAFRRLDKKTQVFIALIGDHYRTRLTHTLEVAQISRDMARRLGLNEDLCEAVSLAHDLGHPPFGHGGEEALNEIMKKHGMNFEHNEQSLLTVSKLEKSHPDFDGLNLTNEVLDGLIKHQTAFDRPGKGFKFSPHLEAQVVNVADEIAYINHDIDDGLRSGFITVRQLKKIKLWQMAEKEVFKKYKKKLPEGVNISRSISIIMSMMITDFCEHTVKTLKKYNIKSLEDIKKHHEMLACFSPQMKALVKGLRVFLFNNFYMDKRVLKAVNKGKMMIKKLFNYYLDNPKNFPQKIKSKNKKDFVIGVKDYIAGMTDLFLAKEYEKLVSKKQHLV